MADGDHAPRRFDFGRPAVVQQPFTHGGVEYKAGEPFPYEQLGLGKLQMYGFWMSSLIDFKAPAPAKAPVAKPAKHAASR